MKVYCINHVFTEFLNSACENFATAGFRRTESCLIKIFEIVYLLYATQWRNVEISQVLMKQLSVLRKLPISITTRLSMTNYPYLDAF